MDRYQILEKKYPLFYKTCCYLQNTFFYRDIFNLCGQIPINYALAEKLCLDALNICNSDWDIYAKRLDNLLEISVDFLKLQALLEKKGAYLHSTPREIEGKGYLWGLYFSQIFWATHHRAFNFFLKEFVRKNGRAGKCLDAPMGSGIFLAQFLSANKNWSGAGVDLSAAAVDFAENIFRINRLAGRVKLFNEDFYKFGSADIFERIICAEFIEHVEDPVAALRKLRALLSDTGKIFLTTVAWAAFVDHIYLYKNVSEIRNHISLSGLKIEKEYVQNIFDKDSDKLEDSKTALNYAAILTKFI